MIVHVLKLDPHPSFDALFVHVPRGPCAAAWRYVLVFVVSVPDVAKAAL